MKLVDKLLAADYDLMESGPINIVALGDSVTHGAVAPGEMNYETVYWNRLRQRLQAKNDWIPINVINTAIAGTTAADALPRMEKQVFSHEPDLVIVCFGLNDVHRELETYLSSLETIFRRCREGNVDVIFMTPNMLNTYVAEDTHPDIKAGAAVTADMQNSGKMDRYIYAAIDLAKSMGVPVCDCYSQWKELSKTQDTTMLLANRVNHPTKEMHQLFSDSLYAMLFPEEVDE